MKPCILIILWGYFLAENLAAQDPGQAQLFYQEGMRALQENDLSLAEDYLKQASDQDPSNFQYHFDLANIYALRYDQTQQGAGGAFYGRESMNAAQSHLQQAIMLQPDFIPAHFNLGILYKNQEQFERARECFKKVIQLAPQETRAYLQVGETYELQGFFDEAREYYYRAREINASDPTVRDALETLRLNESRYEISRKNRDQSSSMSRAASLYREQAISRTQADQGAAQSGAPSLTSLGMMLAQQLMSKKAQE